MVRLAAVFTLACAGLAAAAPIRRPKVMKRAFALQDYAAFQISDGTAGNAQAEANAVFVDPFKGVDLSTVDSDTLDAVQTMREAAEDAETKQFNPAIKAASGDEADALQNGKIKNKVLKLTGEVQALQIQLAQAKASGKDTASIQSKITAEQKKLTTNIATDKKNAGAASKGVTGGAATNNAATASDDSTDASDNAAADDSAAASDDSTAAADNSTAAAGTSGSSVAFAVQDYSAFQISDGTAGNAEAQANAVFVDPFAGVDLATLDDSVAKNMETMRQAAESAETDKFNKQISAASGDAKTALQNGKIKNKVLKLTGEVQVLQIKLAKAKVAGSDTSDISSKITEEQKKLSTNIATDKKNAGQASKGVA
ncbi:hypothetical protein C8Q79DRAFT_1007274 [Trametes meyenii]|nr:hypothetical protein C8Q79DRAFT_1007274 [Trametes meyenii]